MVDGVEVRGCVLVLRGVAATDVPAIETQAKVDPRVAELQALLTPLSVRGHRLEPF
jgi:hypothetical protein